MRKRKAGRPPLAGEAMGLYAFRLPDSLVAKVDAHAKHLQAERAGSFVTRADALRSLVIEGLEAVKRKR